MSNRHRDVNDTPKLGSDDPKRLKFGCDGIAPVADLKNKALVEQGLAHLESPFSNQQYTVGWICTLPIELAAAKGMLDEEHGQPQSPPNPADENTYILGSIGMHRVVVACLPKNEIGSSSAAAVAKDMLHTFPNIRVGLLVGIGAGIPDHESLDIRDVRLGDVVVSSDKGNGGVVAYDFGKKLPDGSFKSVYALNQPPRSLRTAISRLEAEHQTRETHITPNIDRMLSKYPYMRKKGFIHPGQSADRLFKPDYEHVHARSCADCDPAQQVEREPETRFDVEPAVHYGIIATSNTVIKHAPTRCEIQKNEGAICLEMEAAGLMNTFPCIVIRGISDYADSHKNDKWHPYAAATSAAYAKELLEYVQPRLLDEEKAAKEVLNQVSEDVSTIKQTMRKAEDMEILNWLTPVDYALKQQDHIRRREPGTGFWLLESIEFRTWLGAENQTLFCQGIPGAGKTTLTAVVVDYLTRKFGTDGNVGIAFIYCDFLRRTNQNEEHLLISLLKQLCQKPSFLPTDLKALYDRHIETQTRPTLNEIMETIRSVVASYSRVYIIIDALDECSESDGCQSNLPLKMLDLQKRTRANLFITSRKIPNIQKHFSEYPTLEILASHDDISAYLSGRMSHLRGFVSKNGGLQSEIMTTIANAVDGMFLLARLYFDSLQDKTSAREMKDGLKSIQGRGQRSLADDDKAELLSEAYEHAMERIESQTSNMQSLAKRMLSWIVYAKRPLTTLELQHALAVVIGDVELDEDNLRETEDMISECGGLVTVDKDSDVIRLVHYTTQEYFQRTRERWFPDFEDTIAAVCLTYLSFDAFENGFCDTQVDFDDRLSQHPLYDYSAKYWGVHARRASAKIGKLVEGFLGSELKLNASSQALMVSDLDDWEMRARGSQLFPRKLTGMHLAAYFGLIDTIEVLMSETREGPDPYHPSVHAIKRIDTLDTEGRTPLFWAARGGHEAVVQLLLKHHAKFDSTDVLGHTPLLLAARAGHKGVVMLLICRGAKLESRDFLGHTPLHWASSSGHAEMVRLLADHGAEINTESNFGGTPLSAATRKGHDEVVLALTERGVRDDSKTKQDFFTVRIGVTEDMKIQSSKFFGTA